MGSEMCIRDRPKDSWGYIEKSGNVLKREGETDIDIKVVVSRFVQNMH